MSSSDIIAIVAIFVTILIPLTIWLWKRYTSIPELTIEFKFDNGGTNTKGFSDRTSSIFDVPIDWYASIKVYELKWHFKIIIRNNSENTAYYPKIFFKDNQPQLFRTDKLNPQKAIIGNAEIELIVDYKEIEECIASNRTKPNDFPSSFYNFKILLEYQNSSKLTFYSLYNHKFKETRKYFFKPKGFDVK